MKLAVLVNPNSGRHRGTPDLLKTYSALPDCRVLLTEKLEDVAEACAEIARLDPGLVAIAGGDGTQGHAIGELRKIFGERPLPPILPLKGGTMNMVAHSVGSAGAPGAVLRRVLKVPVNTLKLHRRDTLLVNGRTGFIFGLGLVSNFLEAYYEGPRRGPIKAAELVARAIPAIILRNALYARLFRPQAGTLDVPGHAPERALWTAILIQTIENLGIGFRPMYRALQEPGKFHCLATDLSALQILRRLPLIFHGRPWPDAGMRDRTANRLRFMPEGDAVYTLDGELHRAGGAIEISIGQPVNLVGS